uniref:Reverse transcriptase Ty1/copia-type domain-containing protein n=1 Tax=Fagus sylvatica TaxID=28930 RepID=A0A2N9F1C3_FAGSY
MVLGLMASSTSNSNSHTTHTTVPNHPLQTPSLQALLLLLSNMANLMSIKIDSTNFIVWKHQLSSILRAYSMIEFVEWNNSISFSVSHQCKRKSHYYSESRVPTLEYQKSSSLDFDQLDSITFNPFNGAKNTRDKLIAVGTLIDNEELLHIILKETLTHNPHSMLSTLKIEVEEEEIMARGAEICGKTGHQALDFYHRMDFAYQGRHPPAKLAAMASTSNASQVSETWLTDTGATDHLTANVGNLTVQAPYKGTDQVTVGNGQSIPINNIGTDLPSGKVLYRGLSENGLYPTHTHHSPFVPSVTTSSATASPSNQAFLFSRNKWQLWHQRLGHPSDRVLISALPSLSSCVSVNNKHIQHHYHPHIDTTIESTSITNPSVEPIPTPIESITPHNESASPNESPIEFASTVVSHVEPVLVVPPVPINTHPMHTRSENGIFKPKSFHTATIDYTQTEPPTYQTASKVPQWCSAMTEEHSTLQRQQTSSLDPPPLGKNIVGLRLILALAVTYNWPLRQLDVRNAFLHGVLKEEVYMVQPPGYIDANFPQRVCHLHKSIYGLKQAPRAWFESFIYQLLNLGFHSSSIDSSLFIYKAGSAITFLLLYVDDIVLTGNNPQFISQLIHNLSKVFELKDMGSLSYFLGLQIERSTDGLSLTQTKLSATEGTPPFDVHAYRSLVGPLHYLTFTRPGLSFAVYQVCQFMHAPTDTHLVAAKRILRYIRGTFDHGLHYTYGTISLSAFTDADWVGDPNDRRSVFWCF